jgi:hypothetical protein
MKWFSASCVKIGITIRLLLTNKIH